MADREEIQENLKEWLENPSRAEYYHSAPSERCREFIALEFYYSEYEDEEVLPDMDAIEEKLDAAELRHLAKWCGENPRKGILLRRIAEMESGNTGDK